MPYEANSDPGFLAPLLAHMDSQKRLGSLQLSQGRCAVAAREAGSNSMLRNCVFKIKQDQDS